MSEKINPTAMQDHLNNCSLRIGLSSLERMEEIQYTLQSYLSAGATARALDDDARAEHLYHEAIKLALSEFEEVIPELAIARYFLSVLYYDTSELVASEVFARSALNLFTQIYGANHPTTQVAKEQLNDVRIAFQERQSLELASKPELLRLQSLHPEYLRGELLKQKSKSMQAKTLKLCPVTSSDCSMNCDPANKSGDLSYSENERDARESDEKMPSFNSAMAIGVNWNAFCAMHNAAN